MNAMDLRNLIVDLLVYAADGKAERWRRVIGDVHVSQDAGEGCNWRVDACGGPLENDAVERVVELVAVVHPRIEQGGTFSTPSKPPFGL
jgi:hypothetical protein